MSKISEAWKSLGDDGKKPYNDAAAAAKAKYIEEHGEDALKRNKSKMKKKKKRDSAKKDTQATNKDEAAQGICVGCKLFVVGLSSRPIFSDRPPPLIT